MLNEISKYYQPIIIFLIGVLLFLIIGYLNWYPGIKSRIVDWIKQKLYHNSNGGDVMADGLFMTITGYALAISLGFLLIGGIYLSGIKL